MNERIQIDRLAILGVGLIGGSLARVLRRGGICNSITGFGRREENLKKAVELGVIDDYSMQPEKAVSDADMVVIATPLSTMDSIFNAMKASIQDGATITDVGSVKGSVINSAREHLGPDQFRRFVPGHPIAGTEKSGVEASFAELYEQHLVILTPTEQQDNTHLDRVRQMWEAAGAEVVDMTVEHHDQVLAATSHLPHALAYALVDCLAGMQSSDEIFRYAAGGFADFTRIASSNPDMWSDICNANRENLVNIIDRFDTHINAIRQAIDSGDKEMLMKIFTRSKQARDGFIHKSKLKS